MRAYFDHNATTPPDPAVREAVTRALTEDFGNPSSVHHFGQRAKALLDEARSSIADLIGAEPAEIVFTSGGTEADNLALRGAADAAEAGGRRHLISTAIEHEAVLNTVKALTKRGWTATLLPVDATGVVSPAALAAAMTRETAIVSVMHANNEIGTIQPIADLAAIAHEFGALFHTDAVQSVAKIPVSVRDLGVDLLSLSAHKFNGPKGTGALWIRRGTRLVPTMRGGKHERNRRGGTETVPGIAGMGAAARLARQKLATESPRIAALRDGGEQLFDDRIFLLHFRAADSVDRFCGMTGDCGVGMSAEAVNKGRAELGELDFLLFDRGDQELGPIRTLDDLGEDRISQFEV